VYGFERMLNRIVGDERPTHVIACFDAGIPAERLAAAPQYKANRPATPDDLESQFPIVRQVLEAWDIPIVEVEGEEADDCIATLAAQASREGVRTIVVSGDNDLLQLVDDRVTVVLTRRGISDLARYDVAAVRERYGLTPAQLPDYRGLKGDPSDNLAGVPGIGEKTAVKLIAAYGSLDALLARVDEVTPPRIAGLLAEHAAQARACRDVSTAKRGLPIAVRWDECELRTSDPSARNKLFAELGFRSLQQGPAAPPARRRTPNSVATSNGAALTDVVVREAPPIELVTTAYRLVVEPARVLEVVAAARNSSEWALTALPAPASWRDPEPIAFAIARAPGVAEVIPSIVLLRDAAVREAFAALLAGGSAKIVHGAKALAGWFAARDLPLYGVAFDAQLAHGLLDTSRVDPTFAETLEFAGAAGIHRPLGAAQSSMELFAPAPELAAAHASAADALLRAAPRLRSLVDEAGMGALLRDVEQPLAPVLAAMERTGFRLDLDELARIRGHLERVMAETSAAIFAIAGAEFNINSPRALGEVLFEKLGLPHGGKTKTGYATGIEVLAPLAAEHPIAASVLEYREVSKLKSTYVDALPALLDPATGLLHTTFHQLGAATGRLSSSDPNLQNIPIRSALGREVRRAFLAPVPGQVLLAADYSQIELRLFAHLSGDPDLIEAFRRGEDIHEYTARGVFALAAEAPIDAELRRRAKAVNFGILYGQGEFGLSQSVGFSRAEAREFIGAYFKRFPQVRGYIDGALEVARERGYVTTLLGRRRVLPDLRSHNPAARAAAERMAINAPLQGSAADLIKAAMRDVARRFEAQGLAARLVLQVHDELIVATPPQELDAARATLADAMEHAMELRVPLVVDFKAGPTWGEAEAAAV
jgi:DNA polymerase I